MCVIVLCLYCTHAFGGVITWRYYCILFLLTSPHFSYAVTLCSGSCWQEDSLPTQTLLQNKGDMNHKIQSDSCFLDGLWRPGSAMQITKWCGPQMKAIWSQCHPSPCRAILFLVFDITKFIFLWISSTNIQCSFPVPSALSYFVTFHYGNTPTAVCNILIETCTVPFLRRLRTA
jgi:hypothetical protein